jgi:hypothetical protein
MKRVKNGRVLLIPASDQTAGHGTTFQARFWNGLGDGTGLPREEGAPGGRHPSLPAMTPGAQGGCSVPQTSG